MTTFAPTASPVTSHGGGDHDLFAHICDKADVVRAYVTGEAIEALCGKKWVPCRDPEGRTVCQPCKQALLSKFVFDSN